MHDDIMHLFFTCRRQQGQIDHVPESKKHKSTLWLYKDEYIRKKSSATVVRFKCRMSRTLKCGATCRMVMHLQLGELKVELSATPHNHSNDALPVSGLTAAQQSYLQKLLDFNFSLKPKHAFHHMSNAAETFAIATGKLHMFCWNECSFIDY
jgi:hypothetical protein